MLAQLVADIQSEFLNEAGEPLFEEAFVERHAVRALPLVSLDVGIEYALSDDADPVVSPDMPDTHRELWVLRTKLLCCGMLRSQASTRLSFTSGDKSMDRSKEATNWAAFCKDLLEEYKALLAKVNPGADESILNVEFSGARYRQGGHHHHC